MTSSFHVIIFATPREKKQLAVLNFAMIKNNTIIIDDCSGGRWSEREREMVESDESTCIWPF